MRSSIILLEQHFNYPWNSTRRRAHIVISILATLLALAMWAVAPFQASLAAPVSPNPEVAATLAALQENAAVFALVPSGNDLYVGGSFTTIGGLNARGVARYNLQSGVWTALGADNVAAGNGVNGLISTILVVGNDVYVGGSFTKAYNNSSSAFISANCIAKWNTVSKTWSALGADAGPGGNGFDGDVVALVALNGSVYLGGTFHNAHNANGNDVAVNGIARWNNGWFALGKGTSTASNAGVVNDLAVIGNDLYVGGSFSGVTNTDNSKLTVDCIARWNTLSSAWAVLGAGNGSGNNGVSGDVFTLTTNGTELYVGGGFSSVNNSTANKVPANHLARWNGTSWGVVGSAATANSNGVNGNVTELSISNGVLYVGGSFDSTINNGTTSSANCIARWTGSAWERFGTGTGTTGNGVDQDVWVIAPIGNMIYVGGEFTSAYNSSGNTVNVTKLARWNGSSWSGLSAAAVKALATVSAASFSAGELTAEGIVAAYGTGLATTTLAATTTPLPTTLAGTSVAVRDSAGVTRSAPLFFVSGGQINFMIPTGTAAGVANITVTSGDASLSGGDVTVANVAPGLFTMNTNGQGVVAAVALRTKSNGVQTYETVADFNTSTQRWVTKPIDLGPATDVVYLIAYGSGFRNRSALANVSTTIGGTAMLTDFAGKQGGLVGVDQLNVKLDRSLIGRGELDLVLRVDNKPANTVKVNIK